MGAVIIYGPQGCGKTRNAPELMRRYRKSVLLDEGMNWPLRWNKPMPPNALVLTCDENAAKRHAIEWGSRAIPFSIAKATGGAHHE